jgi:hypothetical protein
MFAARIVLGMGLLLPAIVAAQDVVSGPEKGTKVPALKVADITGQNAGKEVDYAAERDKKATIYLFIRADQWDRPMARFVRKLDQLVQQEKSYVVAVWLTEDVEKTKEYLPLAQQSLKFEATALTCYPGKAAGPDGWNVNGDARLTAVIAANAKVAATFGYQSLNETNVDEVISALKKANN